MTTNKEAKVTEWTVPFTDSVVCTIKRISDVYVIDVLGVPVFLWNRCAGIYHSADLISVEDWVAATYTEDSVTRAFIANECHKLAGPKVMYRTFGSKQATWMCTVVLELVYLDNAHIESTGHALRCQPEPVTHQAPTTTKKTSSRKKSPKKEVSAA